MALCKNKRYARWHAHLILLWLLAGNIVLKAESGGSAPEPLSGSYLETQIDPSAVDNFSLSFFRIWLPSAPGRVSGILVVLPGSDGHGAPLADDSRWQAVAARWNYALVGVTFTTSGFSKPYYQAEAGSGNALLAALGRFAKMGNHPELENVPIAIFGHSQGGQFAFHFACWKPQRVIAFAAVKGGYYSIAPDDAARAVPGLLLAGELDSDYRVKNIRRLFLSNQTPSSRWAYALEPKVSHEVARSLDLILPFFDAVISRRLQPCRGNLETLQMQPSDIGLGAWLPNAEVARTWAEFMRGSLSENSLNLTIPYYLPPELAHLSIASYVFGKVEEGADAPTAVFHIGRRKEGGVGWDAVRAFSVRKRLAVNVERSGDEFVVTARPLPNIPLLGMLHDTIEVRFEDKGIPVLAGAQINATWNQTRKGLSVMPSSLYLGTHAGDIERTIKISTSGDRRLSVQRVRLASGVSAKIEVLNTTDASVTLRCDFPALPEEGQQVGTFSILLAEPFAAEVIVPFFGYCKPAGSPLD